MRKVRTSFTRLRHIRRVAKKHSLGALFSQLALSAKARFAVRCLFGTSVSNDASRGERIRLALQELGPVFIKLGQALSTRPDLLPADIALELTKLQDQVPPIEGDTAIKLIHATYGDQFDQIFASVETEPMASASVAQVHAARLNPGNAIKGKNGIASDQVIIKVLRPGIEKTIDSDLGVMYLLAGLLQKHWARGNQFKPLEVIEEYDHTIHDELDLRTEAGNCARMGSNFEHTDIIYVPTVYWDYTHQNVMVMERIHGTSIREFDELRAAGHSLEQLANDGVAVFFKQAFEDNFFHADMHPGNIFVSDRGKWIAVDFGIMGTLTDQDKRYLGEMFLGFFNRDYRSIVDAHIRAKWVPADTRADDFEAAIRTVCEPIFAKPISEISFGKVLLQLFQTVRRFEIPVQPQLVLLYKTLLNIEGLGRQLYPDLNLWDTAKPYLEEWMKQQMSPQALFEDIKREWPQWQAMLPKLPEYVESFHAQASHGNTNQLAVLRQQLNQRERQNNLVRFHQIFGFTVAVCSLAIYLLGSSQLLSNTGLIGLAPWSGVAGLVWAYYHSR